MSGRDAGRGPARAALVASLLSGMAALVYEVVWVRPLGLVVGHTVNAITAVLATFLGGLGLGSAVAAMVQARLDARERRRAYAAIECAVAVCGLAFPATASLFVLSTGGGRLAVAMALLLPPAMLMGAALPLLTSLVPSRADRPGGTAGLLYAANTAGAVVGTLATAFVLLPALGVRGASACAAALNLGAAAVVLVAGRRWADEPAPVAEAKGEATTEKPSGEGRAARRRARRGSRAVAERQPPRAPEPAIDRRVVCLSLALSGLAALAGEVAWTRALVLLIGPTAYAFAFILAAVIVGLTVGSAVAAQWADRLARPARALGLVQVTAALGALALAYVIGHLPLAVGRAVRAHADDMGQLMALQLAWVVGLLLLPCALSGAAFPLGVRLLARNDGDDTAAAVGRAYAWNTAGAVTGSVLAGLVALPAVGLEATLKGAAMASALAGGAVLAASAASFRMLWAAGALALPLAAAYALPRWDRELLAGGPYKYAAYADAERLEEELRGGELIFYREGAVSTVSVKRLGGTLSLAVDGKVDATTGGDMPTQRLLAHVPLLLHPAPRRACVIGLGSGVTAGSALTYPLTLLDVVELSPDVVAAAPLFRAANRDALADPRLRLVVDDGRHHLQAGARTYDVIISEPSNPWMAGVSPLFTTEFFRLGASRLAPGGLFCQWLHLYNLAQDDVRSLVGGFTDAFPHTALFLVNEGDALLVGSKAALPAPSAAALAERMAATAVRHDLAGIDVGSPYGIASLFAVATPALREWTSGVPRHTDDRPRLEFRAPRSLHANTAGTNRQAIQEAGRHRPGLEPFTSILKGATPADLVERARLLERGLGYAWAFDVFTEAARRDPRLPAALEGLVRCALRSDRSGEARRLLEELAAGPSPVEARVGLGLLDFNTSRLPQALEHLREAIARDPAHARALVLAAEVQQSAGNLEAALGLARAAVDVRADEETLGLLASIELAKGDAGAALTRAQSVLARHPTAKRAMEVSAIARAQTGDRAGARRAFEALLAHAPDDVDALVNFGIFEMEAGDAAAAARSFVQAATLSPADARGYEGLRQAALRMGDDALRRRAEAGLARLAAGGGR